MSLSKTMPELLLELLQELESIGIDNKEIYDSVYREEMGAPIWCLFIRPVDEYEWPDDFGLYSDIGNRRVKQALQVYVENANIIMPNSLTTFHQRLAAFQDENVKTENISVYFDDFFGWANPDKFNRDGSVIRSWQEKRWYLQQVLYELLQDLEKLCIESPEIYSPVCRKQMSDLIWMRFILPKREYDYSKDLGFSNDINNQKAEEILRAYIREVNREISSVSLSFHQRLAIFQDRTVITRMGRSNFDKFFIWREPNGFDAVGKWFGVNQTNNISAEDELEEESVELYPTHPGQLSLFDRDRYLNLYPIPEGQLSLFEDL
jgi:hypothetical protein